MFKCYYVFLLLFVAISGFVCGGYEAHTLVVEELGGQTLQAFYSTTLHYDFSEIVDSSQVISRLIISISGYFTPGIGYFEGEYGPLDNSEIIITPFDNHVHMGRWVSFPKESTMFSVVLDSQEMIGLYLPGIWDEPYPGYSGDTLGSIDFIFAQGQTLSTVVETWPVIQVTEATYTLYLIPEPISLLFMSCGVLILRKRISNS